MIRNEQSTSQKNELWVVVYTPAYSSEWVSYTTADTYEKALLDAEENGEVIAVKKIEWTKGEGL